MLFHRLYLLDSRQPKFRFLYTNRQCFWILFIIIILNKFCDSNLYPRDYCPTTCWIDFFCDVANHSTTCNYNIIIK